VQVRWAQGTPQKHANMAGYENEELRRQIDNLIRDLKRSRKGLDETRDRLQTLFKLTDSRNRGAKRRDVTSAP
jgi:hypothetical protein